MSFNPKLLFVLFFGFILFTIIGTLSHEFGHYAMAKIMGYEAQIHYGMTENYDKENRTFIDSCFSKYLYQIKYNLDFPEKEKFLILENKYHKDDFWIVLAGPIQTMLTGSIGLVFIIVYKRFFIKNDNLSTSGWMVVFLTLFWLRQTANLLVGVYFLIILGKFQMIADEIRLAARMNIPIWSISILTGIIGAFVLFFVVFKIIPIKQRFTFILAGFFGGITGYILWLQVLGPAVLP